MFALPLEERPLISVICGCWFCLWARIRSLKRRAFRVLEPDECIDVTVCVSPDNALSDAAVMAGDETGGVSAGIERCSCSASEGAIPGRAWDDCDGDCKFSMGSLPPG